MSREINLLMVGLKGSGKTSYLAALWHFLEASEIPGRLSTPELQPDREYLNSIRTKWLAGQQVGRTPARGTHSVVLPVRDLQTGSDARIELPDLSGETFLMQWATRKATASYAKFATNCDGALLLIYPETIVRTELIGTKRAKPEATDRASPPVPWSPDLSSTQVQLVDLLQTLLTLRSSDEPFRLAVGISAWDLVTKGIRPGDWIDRRTPLLAQFLKANWDRFASRVYGISALGGDLGTDRDRLLNFPIASDRVNVVGEAGDSVGVAAPIEFLLNL